MATTIKRSPLLGALVICLLSLVSCSCPATPSISSISPNSATAGGGDFVLTVNGGNFSNSSVLVWNGTSMTSSFVNSHQLTATIPASNIALPDTAVVYVYNPGSTTQTTTVDNVTATENNQCGAAGSNSTSFTVIQ